MALEGSIEEFGLADILQLIYFQKKTGLLTIDGRLGRIKVSFHEGKVVAAESKRRSEDNRLGKILVKKALLSEEKLKEVLDGQKASGEKLGTALVKSGLVSKEAIQEIIVNQITEIIVQLFSWKKGTYEFRPQKIQLDKDLEISVDTQHLLMDGVRIVDEWAVIEGKFTLDTVFQKTGKRGIELTEEEKEILEYIDGDSDVSTVIEVSGEEDFQVSKILVALLEKKALKVAEQKAFVVEKKPQRKGWGVQIHILPIIINFIILISFIVSLSPLFILKQDTRIITAVKDIRKIGLALEIEKFSKGVYPPTLKSIDPAGADPWGEEYIYRANVSGYVLKSNGPDGIPDTPDDIY